MTPVAFQPGTTSELAEQALTSIAKILDRRRISAREVCRRVGEQHTWLSKRFAGEHALTLNDVARIADAINEPAADLLGFPQAPLARSEARDVDEILKDRDIPRHIQDYFLGLIGQAVALVYASVPSPKPKRRALPAPPKEPQMTTRKATPRRR
jgi:transcriptional regulator with XRE-family HTH domain